MNSDQKISLPHNEAGLKGSGFSVFASNAVFHLILNGMKA
jgi:hypothetical protein